MWVMQDWQEVKQGVQQGSVHGPMFSNIFINDLFLQIKTAQYMYMYIRKYTAIHLQYRSSSFGTADLMSG